MEWTILAHTLEDMTTFQINIVVYKLPTPHYLWHLSQHSMGKAWNISSVLWSKKTRNGGVEWNPDWDR